MFEWIGENKCLCHVNALLKQPNPIEHLRLIYNICKTLQILLTTSSGQIQNQKFEEYEQKMMNLIRDLDMVAKEETSAIQDLTRNLESIKSSNKKTKELLRSMLSEKTNEMVEIHLETVAEERNLTIVQDWIDNSLKKTETNTDNKKTAIKMKELWDNFKKNPRLEKQFKKTQFEHIIRQIFKVQTGTFALKGYVFA